MRYDPDAAALANLHEAHARMRSSLALLDLVDGTGYSAAYLQHAIYLLEEQLEPGTPASERKLFQSF